MTITILTLLIAVCIIAYAIEITFALAGTILMVTVMSFFVDTKTLVIFSALPQILVASIGLIRSPRVVKFSFLLPMLGFAVTGAVAGLYMFYFFSTSVFQVLLASAVTLFGLYLVIAPGRIGLHPLLARILDTLAGASQALFGISGPIAMTRLLATFDDKLRVRNYALAFFLPLNLFRVGGYLLNGTISPEIQRMMLYAAPVLAVSLWFSSHLHLKVNEQVFRTVAAWLILGGGVSLFLH